MQIKPKDQLTAEEINELAIATAERGDDLDTANIFDAADQRRAFRNAYLKREAELAGELTTA